MTLCNFLDKSVQIAQSKKVTGNHLFKRFPVTFGTAGGIRTRDLLIRSQQVNRKTP